MVLMPHIIKFISVVTRPQQMREKYGPMIFEGNLKKTVGEKYSYIFTRPECVSVSRSDGKISVLDDKTSKSLGI